MSDRLRLLVGDCRETLRTLDAESVQCCVTSPPYWGLRDYGTASWDGGSDECDHKAGSFYGSKADTARGQIRGGPFKETCGKCGAIRIDQQIGLERTPDEYIGKMLEVFAEVWRVLKPDATLWLNLGDCYNAYNGNAGPGSGFSRGASCDTERPKLESGHGLRTKGLKPKDLVGIPWRMAFALQREGWYLRSDIIWHKPNPMPESVQDRPTKAHEYIFLLTKAERYYYDYEAIAEPAMGWNGSRFDDGKNLLNHPNVGIRKGPGGKWSTQDPQSSGRRIVDRTAAARASGADHDSPFGETRNKRSVWSVSTQPYSDAHFATFPPELIRPCILAGTRAGDTVLDPFGGSGTTGMVAIQEGRKAILCELNPEYAKLIEQRTHTTPGLGL